MTCARIECGKHFVPQRKWGKYCSARCGRLSSRQRQRDRQRAASGKPPLPVLPAELPRPCAQCAATIEKPRRGQQYCNDSCRNRANCAKQKAIARPRFRRLKCHFCRGRHVSAACPNRNGTQIKLYGTLGPNREYIPPPGVRVRVLVLPNTVHGDMLKDYAKGGAR